MTKQECIAYVESHMEIRYATKNGAYTAKKFITPQGAVNHSVGCAQPNPEVFFNSMNSASAGWGVMALLGDFDKGDGKIILTLPYNARCWGVGSGSKGSWNNTKVQWEICEPAGHTYAGGTMVNYNVAKNQAFFDHMWKMVVAWNVYICDKFGYSPSSISDHSESYKAGMGSNHADVGQWWPKHGKTMNDLRNEVKAIMNGGSSTSSTPSQSTTSYAVPFTCVTTDNLNCRDTYSTKGKILKTYTKGTKLTITKVSDTNWGYTGEGWVSLAYVNQIQKVSSTTTSTTFKVGDKVKCSATYSYDGKQKLASFVRTNTYRILQIGGKNLPSDRVVIGLNGQTTAAVKMSTLTKV